MVIRKINMAQSRDTYIKSCENTSQMWIEHAIKLLMFDSPQNESHWINEVCNGFVCETVSMKNKGIKKPTIEHLSSITDRLNNIEDRLIHDSIMRVALNRKYQRMNKRPNFSESKVKSALINLVESLDSKKVYDSAEINNLVNNWYDKYK